MVEKPHEKVITCKNGFHDFNVESNIGTYHLWVYKISRRGYRRVWMRFFECQNCGFKTNDMSERKAELFTIKHKRDLESSNEIK